MPPIDRGFRRIAAGLVHYREAGAGAGGDGDAPPLLMIHGGPGSWAGLAPMIAALAAGRRVIAPDLMGNGDSDPPPLPPVTIAFHADCIAALLDALGVERVDVYGHHSGAQVACELTIAAPERVRRLVLDGVALFSADQRAEFAEHYAPPVIPDAEGSHLAWIWDFASNLTRYFPHYRRDDDHRIEPATTLPPDIVTSIAAEIVKTWPTYHLLYAAAFAHDMASRLPLVRTEALVLEIDGDPLARYASEAADSMPASRTIRSTRVRRREAIDDFLIDRTLRRTK